MGRRRVPRNKLYGPRKMSGERRKPKAAPAPYKAVPAAPKVGKKPYSLNPKPPKKTAATQEVLNPENDELLVILPDEPEKARSALRPSMFYARASVSTPPISIRNYNPGWNL